VGDLGVAMASEVAGWGAEPPPARQGRQRETRELSHAPSTSLSI